MITFLSSCKKFNGLVGANQTRAIQSWLAVHPATEVILFGNTEGIENISQLDRVKVVCDVEATSTGVPYFDSIAKYAQHNATYDNQVYLNSDIIVSKSILLVISKIHLDKFLMIGQRINLRQGVIVNITKDGYLDALDRLICEGNAGLNDVTAIDYFVFPRGQWRNLRPLVIGRAGYDNALVAYCLRKRIPVVDSTFAILALHQGHDYSHIPGGLEEITSGKEAEDNKKLHGVKHSAPDIADATWIIKNGCVVPNNWRHDQLRKLEIACHYVWNMGPAWIPLRVIWRLLVGAGLYPRTRAVNIMQVLEAQQEYLLKNR